MVRSQICV
uniref:Uncharacterized protein n=1 Tax=Rhizophora mucronata TaxID=61149 RepID=A0A2P2PQR0_RHIMU